MILLFGNNFKKLTEIRAGHRFAFIGGEIESGYSGAKAYAGIPSSLTFMDWTFNTTTGTQHAVGVLRFGFTYYQ